MAQDVLTIQKAWQQLHGDGGKALQQIVNLSLDMQ
jgi:hypothetical protein